MKEDAQLKRNAKVFFKGDVSDTTSVYKLQTNKFFNSKETPEKLAQNKFSSL